MEKQNVLTILKERALIIPLENIYFIQIIFRKIGLIVWKGEPILLKKEHGLILKMKDKPLSVNGYNNDIHASTHEELLSSIDVYDEEGNSAQYEAFDVYVWAKDFISITMINAVQGGCSYRTVKREPS